ncbi:hypothetical protein WJX73_008315 [Symbiochloris irregularis]|uniref:U-box domain-containing protein n=1 Tax=Symbiochloris irregularis TaxID=706552 RepID=A0AAW1P975_9CHLO
MFLKRRTCHSHPIISWLRSLAEAISSPVWISASRLVTSPFANLPRLHALLLGQRYPAAGLAWLLFRQPMWYMLDLIFVHTRWQVWFHQDWERHRGPGVAVCRLIKNGARLLVMSLVCNVLSVVGMRYLYTPSTCLSFARRLHGLDRLSLSIFGAICLTRHLGYVLSGIQGRGGIHFGELILIRIDTMKCLAGFSWDLHNKWPPWQMFPEPLRPHDPVYVLRMALLHLAATVALHRGLRHRTFMQIIDGVLQGLQPHVWSRKEGLVPMVAMPDELADAFDECHDMLCPITQGLIVEPVVLHGKVYERWAITLWLKKGRGVPHSPMTQATVRDLQPCAELAQVLEQCRKQYHLKVIWEQAGL